MIKSPFWESSTGALTTLLNTGKFVQADLITIDFIPQPVFSSATFIPTASDIEWNYAAAHLMNGNNVHSVTWSFWAKNYIGGPALASFFQGGGQSAPFMSYNINFEVYGKGNTIFTDSDVGMPYAENTNVGVSLGAGELVNSTHGNYDNTWHHYCGFADWTLYAGTPGIFWVDSRRVRSWVDGVEIGCADGITDPTIGFCQSDGDPSTNVIFNNASFPSISFNTPGSGAAPDGTAYYDMWIAYDQVVDFTNPDNILKFRTAAGHPANLGTNGSTPTGSQPNIYMTGPPSTFVTNKGSGADGTVYLDNLFGGPGHPLVAVDGP